MIFNSKSVKWFQLKTMQVINKMENQYSGSFKFIDVTEQNYIVIGKRRKHVTLHKNRINIYNS